MKLFSYFKRNSNKENRHPLEKCRELKSMVHLPSEASLLSYSTNTSHTEDPSYSNFYMKLPNGNWMVRYRTRERKIINSYEIKGNLI